MRIICESCSTKYSIADEKVRRKVFKIRCKKCGHIIVVKGTADQPEPAAAGGGFDAKETRVFDYSGFSDQPSAEEAVWHLVVDGEQVGPVTAEQVRQKYADGQVDSETYVWREGFADWVRLGGVNEFSDLDSDTSAVSSPFSAGSAAPAQEGGADFFSQPAFDGRNTASAAPAGGADLFALAEPAVQPAESAKPKKGLFAAPAAEPAPAASGDLFGAPSGVASRGSLFPEEEEEGKGAWPSMTGQRNENSVLFSLSNLQSLATSSPRAPLVGSTGFGSKIPEGSGLLDIRTMAASTLGHSGGDASTSANVAVPSSFLGGPIASPILMPVAPERPGWLIPALVFGTVLVVAVVVLGIIVVTRKPTTKTVTRSETVAKTDDMSPARPSGTEATGMNSAPKGTQPATADGMTPAVPSMTEGTATGMETGMEAEDPKDKKGKRRRKGSSSNSSSTPRTRTTRTDRGGPVFRYSRTEERRTSRGEDTLVDLLGPSPRTRTSEPSPPRPVGPSKESLTASDIKSGIGRVRGRVQRCYDKYRVPGMIRLSVTVSGSSGRVSSASVRGRFSGTPTGSCVSRAVYGARFPKFRRSTQRFIYPFILR